MTQDLSHRKFIHPSIPAYTPSSLHPFIHLSHSSIHPSFHLSIPASIYPSSIHPSFIPHRSIHQLPAVPMPGIRTCFSPTGREAGGHTPSGQPGVALRSGRYKALGENSQLSLAASKASCRSCHLSCAGRMGDRGGRRCGRSRTQAQGCGCEECACVGGKTTPRRWVLTMSSTGYAAPTVILHQPSRPARGQPAE